MIEANECGLVLIKYSDLFYFRNANQFMRTVSRPVIYAGTFDGASRNSTFEDHHSLRVEDFGNSLLFDPEKPFKDKGPIQSKDFIDNSDINEYPQVYFDPSAKSISRDSLSKTTFSKSASSRIAL